MKEYVGNTNEYVKKCVKNVKESLPSYMVSGTSRPCKLTTVALGGTSGWGGPWRSKCELSLWGEEGEGKL